MFATKRYFDIADNVTTLLNIDKNNEYCHYSVSFIPSESSSDDKIILKTMRHSRHTFPIDINPLIKPYIRVEYFQ